MHIGFDIRPFLKEETGVGVYFKNLLFQLARMDRVNEYYLFSSSFKDKFSRDKIPPFSKKRFLDLRIPVRAVNYFWYRLGWPPLDYFFRTKLDLTHSPTPIILPTRGKKIVTVYDLFFLDNPWLVDRETRKSFLTKIRHSLFQADGIIVISEFTKNQLLETFEIEEKKVRVVHLGLSPELKEEASDKVLEEARKKMSLPDLFILFVGATEPRKNLLNLIKALNVIHRKYGKVSLVIAGRRGEDHERLLEAIRKNRLEPWVKITGYVSDREVRLLYRLASVFVYPSLCEGFGLPLLEAMASSLPVVASNTSAIPEVAAKAALYFHPEKPEEMADKIVRVLEDEELRKGLVEKGKKRASEFDWKITASETLEFYTEIAGR